MHQGSAENFPFLFLVVVSSINADVGLSVGSHYAFFLTSCIASQSKMLQQLNIPHHGGVTLVSMLVVFALSPKLF